MDINLLTVPLATPELDKDPALCQVLGCTNRRSNAGYRRMRKVCEKHHRQQFHMPLTPASKTRSLRQQIREDLDALRQVAQKKGLQAVLARIEEMRKKYY